MKRIFLPVLAMTLVTGCSGSWSTSDIAKASGPQHTYSRVKTSPGKILVTQDDIKNRKYTVLGDINVSVNKTTIFNSDPTNEMANEKLKEEAAKLGADAVILVRYGTVGVGLTSWGTLDANGRAVAFVK